MLQPTALSYLKGATYRFIAVSIRTGWSVATRFAVTTNMNPGDIAALRFGIAGVLLLPVVIRQGLAISRYRLSTSASS